MLCDSILKEIETIIVFCDSGGYSIFMTSQVFSTLSTFKLLAKLFTVGHSKLSNGMHFLEMLDYITSYSTSS
jgi:hypothetical protein